MYLPLFVPDFNVTGSVTVMTISNGFNIFWSGVPETVQGYDKNARQLTSNYSVVSLNINCVVSNDLFWHYFQKYLCHYDTGI